MNETKQAWKDVADILEKSGWFASNEGEDSAMGAGDQHAVSLSLPCTKDPPYYRWLPAGAITTMALGFLALFFAFGSPRQKPNGQNLAALQEQREKLQQQLNVLEGAHAKVKRSLEGLDEGSSSLSGDNKNLEKKVGKLQEDNQRMKAALKNALKTQEDLLQALAKEMRGQLDSLNRQLNDR